MTNFQQIRNELAAVRESRRNAIAATPWNAYLTSTVVESDWVFATLDALFHAILNCKECGGTGLVSTPHSPCADCNPYRDCLVKPGVSAQ